MLDIYSKLSINVIFKWSAEKTVVCVYTQIWLYLELNCELSVFCMTPDVIGVSESMLYSYNL